MLATTFLLTQTIIYCYIGIRNTFTYNQTATNLLNVHHMGMNTTKENIKE